MDIIGIVAEYNPFHNGHLYQINKVKELYNDGGFDSYEEAAETAIKYCLENLI